MGTLEIVILGLVPMLTLVLVVAAGLMVDRRRLVQAVTNWRSRHRQEKQLHQALKQAQARLQMEYEVQLQRLRESSEQQFKQGFNTYIEDCQSRLQRELQQVESQPTSNSRSETEFERSSVLLYAAALDATLTDFNTLEPVAYRELLAPLRQQLLDATVTVANGAPERAVTEKFRSLFKAQEQERSGLRELIEEVYRGGKVVVKDNKDKLVLALEQQLRDRVAQQKDMLLHLQRLENQLRALQQRQHGGNDKDHSLVASESPTPDSQVIVPPMLKL